MARMIDRIFKEGVLFQEKRKEPPVRITKDAEMFRFSTEWKESPFDQAEVFIIDSVTKYLLDQDPPIIWRVSDFPNLAPPYPIMWMEAKRPSSLTPDHYKYLGLLQIAFSKESEAVEVLVERLVEEIFKSANESITHISQDVSRDLGYDDVMVEEIDLALRSLNMGIPHSYDDSQVKWGVLNFLFVQNDEHSPVLGPVGMGIWAVTRDGGMMPVYTEDKQLIFSDFWFHPEMERMSFKERADFINFCRSTMSAFWMAVSFMHCKNVKEQSVDPCHPQGKRNPRQPCRRVHFKTLAIDPMKQVLRQAKSVLGEHQVQTALHTFRGHFKDYRQGKGLFGKYKGLYWWDGGIRGDSEHGMVVKDYASKSPTERRLHVDRGDRIYRDLESYSDMISP